MPITFVASGSVPADGGSNSGSPINITLPTSIMRTGDLIYSICFNRNQNTSISLSSGGGLDFRQMTDKIWTSMTVNIFWAIYYPNLVTSSTITYTITQGTGQPPNTTAIYIIVRPPNQYMNGKQTVALSQNFPYDNYEGYNWAIGSIWGTDLTGTTTCTLSPPLTLDNFQPPNIWAWFEGIAFIWWCSIDDNTWGLTGAGWTKSGMSAQYRNLAGSDSSISLAYIIYRNGDTIADVTQEQLTLGPDDTKIIGHSFYWYNHNYAGLSQGHPFVI